MKKYVVTVVVLVALSMVASANLLLNSDFALNGTAAQFGTASINNWSVWGTSGWYNDDIGSQMSVKTWWDDTGIYQDWACTPGTEYLLGIDARQRSTELLTVWNGFLKVEFYDASLAKIAEQQLGTFLPSSPTDTWVHLSGSYTAPAGAITGRIVLGVNNYGSGVSGSAYFDNAAVDPVVIPEPSLAGLVLLGGLGLAMLRGRRK